MQISVLIATRDRAEILAQTLAAFQQLESGGLSWELIIVDNGSSDATNKLLEQTRSKLPLVALQEPEPGKNKALNRALAVAQGELLVFTDDDVIPVKNWLIEWWELQARWPNDDVFGARILPRFPPNTPAWISDPNFVYASHAFGRCELSDREEPVESPPFGANLAIRSYVFQGLTYNEAIGPAGGNYAQGSEHELLLRLQREGKRFIYSPRPVVEHLILPNQISVDWLLGRAYRIGRGYARLRSVPRQRIAGVPWTVWPRYLVNAFMYYCFHRFQSDARRFAGGQKYHFFRGLVFEHRNCLSRHP